MAWLILAWLLCMPLLCLAYKRDFLLWQRERLVRWLVERQSGGGLQGRPNKPPDTCYTFWIGATLKVSVLSKGSLEPAFVQLISQSLDFVYVLSSSSVTGFLMLFLCDRDAPVLTSSWWGFWSYRRWMHASRFCITDVFIVTPCWLVQHGFVCINLTICNIWLMK